MTSIEATEILNTPKLQIWNNDAFDDGDSQVTSSIEPSWSNLPPDFINNSFNSDGSNEDQIQILSSLQSSVLIGCSNVQEKPQMAWCEASSVKSKVKFGADLIKGRDEREIDAEIEEAEKEIGRLSTRLESLRLEKAEQNTRSIATRGRIVPAVKFMESQKPIVKIDDSSLSRSKPKLTCKGVSLGPGEISSTEKKSNTATPLQSAQNRRKSCSLKLPGIEEDKVTIARGRKSLTLSPKSRKAASAHKQAATTVGSKRLVKKEEGFLSSIQPKKLFKEEDKNLASKKPGRFVASRYNHISTTQTAEKDTRKRSLPKNKKEIHRSEKKRASDENSKVKGIVKNICETPICKELPKLTELRLVEETPRDSGPAKRVAELESKNYNFTFCQLLSFED